MPRVSFNQEFKSADTDRFPKLKLDGGEVPPVDPEQGRTVDGVVPPHRGPDGGAR